MKFIRISLGLVIWCLLYFSPVFFGYLGYDKDLPKEINLLGIILLYLYALPPSFYLNNRFDRWFKSKLKEQ